MNAEPPTPAEEALTAWLVACDKALAAGTATPDCAAAETPAELRPQLERRLAYLRLLRQVLPRRPPVRPSPPGDGLPYTSLGRFQILRELGRGAFGLVFQAYDPHLGRDVALKVPRPEVLVSAELRERFIREARAAAGLDHPHVVPVYEAGAVGTICYIASAYCPGLTLANWLRERPEPVPVGLAAQLLAALAEAVQHAHSHGVVHRDLKPSNVLLQLCPESRTPSPDSTLKGPSAGPAAGGLEFIPKVTDFGLAKLAHDAVGGPSAAEAGSTQSGVLVGTPAYMAPEQASGRNRDVGPAADIYGLGVILYEVLVGRPPFQGETTLETLEQVRSQEPVPLRRLRPRVPRDMETICLKCLQKEPQKRYSSAAALAADLRHFLAGEPIQAQPARLWERGSKWARRRPALAGLLTVCALAAVTLAVVILTYTARLQKALVTADEQRRQANSNFRLAREAIDDFSTKVSRDPQLRAHGFEQLRKDFLHSSMSFYQKFVEQQSDDPDVPHEQGRVLGQLAVLTSDIGSKQEAIDLFVKAAATFERLAWAHPTVAAHREHLALCHLELILLYSFTGKSQQVETSHRAARELQEQLIRDDPTTPTYVFDLARNYHNLGLHYRANGQPLKAEQAYHQSAAALERLNASYPGVALYQLYLAATFNNLGLVYRDASQLNLADEVLGKARALVEPLAGRHAHDPQAELLLSQILANLGTIHRLSNRRDKAEAAYAAGLQTLLRLITEHPKITEYHWDLAHHHLALGDLYSTGGRLPQAEAAYREARDLLTRLSDEHPSVVEMQNDLAISYLNLGEVYCHTGRSEQARAAIQAACDRWEKLAGTHPSLARYSANLVTAYSRLGLLFGRLDRHIEALAAWDRAIARAGSSGRDPLRPLRATCLVRLGRHAQAAAEVEVLTRSASATCDDLYNAVCVYSLCSETARRDAVLAAVEREQQAEQYARRAVTVLEQAHAAGFFKEPGRVAHAKQDDDLKSIRPRPDFQKLLRAVERRQ
jgi:serine/threonine protein kinase